MVIGISRRRRAAIAPSLASAEEGADEAAKAADAARARADRLRRAKQAGVRLVPLPEEPSVQISAVPLEASWPRAALANGHAPSESLPVLQLDLLQVLLEELILY